MMTARYNVSTLLKEPVGSTRAFAVDSEVLVDAEQARHQRVVGDGRFLRTQGGVLVTGHFEGEQADRCSRCLREISLPVRTDLEEEFLSTVDLETGARLSAPKDPEAFCIDSRHTLDLEDALRQYWTAALPIQPLCGPGCRGLCSRCGRDLNEGHCACPPEEDSRWSALRELVSRGGS